MSRGPEAQTATGWYVHADGRVWGPYAEHRLKDFVAEGRVSRTTLIGGCERGPFTPAGLQDELFHLFSETAASPAWSPQTAASHSGGSSPSRAAASALSGAPRARVVPPPDPFADLAPSPKISTLSEARPRPPAAQRDPPASSPDAAIDRRPDPDLQTPQGLDRPAPTGASRPLLVYAALRSFGAVAFETVLAQHGPYERIGEGLWLIRARLGPAALRNALSRRLRQDDALLVVEADLEKAAWFNLDLEEERRVRGLWAL